MGRWALHLLVLSGNVIAHRYYAPVYDFLSQPNLRVPKLTVDSYNPENVAPGYIFMAPFSPEVQGSDDSVNYLYGGAIYDNDGELVYSTAHEGEQWSIMDFVVCEYDDKPHLCVSRTEPHPSAQQQNDIINSSYDVVRSAHPGGRHHGWHLEHDLHEFIVRPGNSGWTALQSTHFRHELNHTFEFKRCDLDIKWLKSSVLQEVTLDGRNQVVFEWGSIDHVPLDRAVECGGSDGVWIDGQSKPAAFDHFHMNSFDKDLHGNYYISGRHRSTIYKVSGRDGSVIWRMSRYISDFEHFSEVDAEFDFSYQHHLRLQSDYPGYDIDQGRIILSLFDNANDRYDNTKRTANFSSGKVFFIDEKAKTATLKEIWPLYHGRHQLAVNQGSFQLLPNGNRIVGGGNVQEVVEWQPGNPQPVFHAHFGDWEDRHGGIGHKINSYRNQRFEWKGHPPWKPSIFAYAPDCDAPMTVYVSWNGATEVVGWDFFGSSSENGPFEKIGITARAGFESSLKMRFTNYVYAVAQGQSGKSDIVRVSVPEQDPTIGARCGPTRCEKGFNYEYLANRDCSAARFGAETAATTMNVTPTGFHHCDPCFADSLEIRV